MKNNLSLTRPITDNRAYRSKKLRLGLKLKAIRFSILLLSGIALAFVSNAQNAAQYISSAYSGNFTPITGGTGISAIQADDAHSGATMLNIGFTFRFCGVDYTQFKVSSNGWLSFTNTTGANSRPDNSVAASYTNTVPVIFPLWDDIDGGGWGANASYTTTGTVGSRVLTVQWLNYAWDYAVDQAVISFQIKLYEGTNVIEYCYRQDGTAQNTANSGGASIGIMKTTTDYSILNNSSTSPTASTSTITTNITARPATGQVYRWTPPATCSGTPLAGSATTTTPLFYCQGGKPTLGLAGGTILPGMTYAWESSATSSGPWAPVAGATNLASPDYTFITTVSTSTYYRAVSTCASGGAVNQSAPVQVVVTSTMPNGTAGVVTNTYNCNGKPSLTLTGQAQGAGITYGWEYSTTGSAPWTQVPGATGLSNPAFTVATSITATTYYRAITTCIAGGTATSNTVTVTVNGLAIAPATSSICEGSSQLLAVTRPTTTVTLLDENFNSNSFGALTVNSNVPAGAFLIQPSGYVYGSQTHTPPTATNFAMPNSDVTGTGVYVQTTMTSPVFNTTGYTSLTLSYNYFFRHFTLDTGKLQVYDGSAWIDVPGVLYQGANAGTSTAFLNANIDLSAYVNIPNFQLRFYYGATFDYYLAVDDILLTGVTSQYPLSWTSSVGGGLPAGAGTPSVTNNNISVTPTNTGALTYTVASSVCGTASATVNVTPATVIIAQPAASANVCTGNSINLSVTANNAVSYEWHGPSGIVGTNSATLSIPNATTAMSGNYYVIVNGTSPCSNVQSATSIITVNPAISITTQPAAQTLCEGDDIDLIIDAANVVGYQWYNANGIVNDGGNISGATTLNLIVDNALPTDGSNYYVELAGLPGCGTLNSTAVAVTVNPAVDVTLAPPSIIGVCDGDNIVLAATANNTTAFAWSKDGTPLSDINNISGSQTGTLTVTGSGVADAGDYTVTITGYAPCSSVDITTTITNDHPAAITTQPVNPNSCHGTQGSMTVVATGANLTYQWYQGTTQLVDDATYTGTTSPILTISDVTGLNNLDYSVVITGSCGSPVTSDIVTLTENFSNTWSGTVNNDWSNTSNWSCGILPTSATNAVVPDVPNDPIVDVSTAVCKDLMIDLNASVTFTGTTNKLTVHGNITNNGGLDGTNGTVELAGTAQAISGAAIFGNLDVTGGDVKTIGGNTVVGGILNLNNGLIELGNNSLVLSQPTAQIGGSPTSYIVTNGTGSVSAANMGVGGNPDAVTFHVGIDNTSYTPIMLENLGTADGFQVRVVEDVYADGIGTDPTLVTNPVINRTWMVSESITGGSIVNMTPMWNSPGNEINGFVQTHVFVAHYWNNEWISYVDSANGAPMAVAGPFPGMWMTTQDSIEDFSPFTVASSGQFPLAIRLNSITATNVGPRNKVQWTSSREDKGDMYELESSADGRTFAKIATVAANGKASTYTQWDETPVQGVNYYRVKMLDAAGKFSYSKVVTATVKGVDGFNIEAYPNPVSSTVSIKVNGVVTGKANVTITDITGKLVKEKVQVVDNNASIDVSNLASGAYMINYSDDAHNESIKISKQ